MREISVPPIYTTPPDRNLTDVFVDAEAVRPHHVAVSRLVDGRWEPVTMSRFLAGARRLAGGLMANGVVAGDRIALMSRTRYEWCEIEAAIALAGAVLVPIYDTSSEEQVNWILADSGARAVFVETAEHGSTVRTAMHDIDGITVWGIDDGDLAGIVEAGRSISDAQVEQRRCSRGADDLAMIIYTSGTTGRPKGCMLLHHNFTDYLGNLMPSGMDEVFDPASSTLLFLPLAHSFAQVIQLGALAQGVRLGHSPNIKTLADDLASFRPGLVLSVPRVFEKVYNSAKHKAHAEGHGRIFDRAEAVALAFSRAQDTGGPGLTLRLQHGLFDRLVYRKIREAMGGRVEWTISGGAPLGERLGHFFRGIGVNVLEGYGLTETTAGATVNLPRHQRVGSVGPLIPGMAARINDDGEILLKGQLVFPGYRNNEEATSESFTADGWFMTGDVGNFDDDGFLFITGRKKELIVTSAGKNVAPTVLEDRVRAHPLVSQCLVVGDAQPFVAALVTLDGEALTEWIEAAGLSAVAVPDLVRHPQLRQEIQAAVDEANLAVSHAEAIKKFAILVGDFTEAEGQLTPTLKLKRNVILKEFAADVDALYR